MFSCECWKISKKISVGVSKWARETLQKVKEFKRQMIEKFQVFDKSFF